MESSETFLSLVAQKLLTSDTPIRDQLVVVPTRRAGAFLQRQLVAQIGEGAMILPRIVTIDEWIIEMSERVILDNTALVSLLYEIYAKYLMESPEPQKAVEDSDRMLRLNQTERMLRDFQDMDLALVDVDMLLGNIEELDALDDYSFLTEEEREAILAFWRTLSSDALDDPREEFVHFSVIWREIYYRFNDRLASLGVAYRAAAYRMVAEESFTADMMLKELRRHSGSQLRTVSLVGLYNLTLAELKIIEKLQKADKDNLRIQLYWQKVCLDATKEFTDHLNLTVQNNYARLGGEILGCEYDESLSPKANLLSLNSTVLQPQVVNELVSDILKRDPNALSELRIAIVLNDEKTLIPLMKALRQPDSTSLNVTMGYPLQYTSVATWIRRYLNIFGIIAPSAQASPDRILLTASRLKLWLGSPLTRQLFGHRTNDIMEQIALYHYAIAWSDIREILATMGVKDQDEAQLRSLLTTLLTPALDGTTLLEHVSQLLNLVKATLAPISISDEEEIQQQEEIDQVIIAEGIDQIIRYVTQVSNVLHSSQGEQRHLLDAPQHVAYLLEQLIAVGSIPFEGDPLDGLQVMGFLETRTLTFDYVIMLNVQEGDLPKSSNRTTLIPDALRVNAHMSTYRTEDDTNAYHFYRLIQGAKEVYLLQDSRPKSISSMEPSRYVDQIRYLTHLPLSEYSYADPLKARDAIEHTVPASDDAVRSYLEELASEVSKIAFSPSDLITYYKCPYQFYLKKIKGVGEPRPEPGVVTPIELGSIVHGYLDNFYKGLDKSHGIVHIEDLNHEISEAKLRKLYADIVSTKKAPDEILLTDLKRYIQKALEIDKRLLLQYECDSLQLLASEQFVNRFPFEWQANGVKHKIHISGQADRIDLLNGTYRIVDYKTGQVKKPASVEALSIETLETWRQKEENCKIGGYMLQSYLYALLYTSQTSSPTSKVQPTIYSLAPSVPADQGAIYFDEETLDEVRDTISHYLNLLVDPHGEFTQTPCLKICNSCNYRTICGRKSTDY